MNDSLPSPKEVFDAFLERDKKAIEELNRFMITESTRLEFTECRLLDAIGLIQYCFKKIEELEGKIK